MDEWYAATSAACRELLAWKTCTARAAYSSRRNRRAMQPVELLRMRKVVLGRPARPILEGVAVASITLLPPGFMTWVERL